MVAQRLREKKWHAKEAWPKKKGGEPCLKRKKRGGGDDKRERAISPYIHPSTQLHIFDRDCMTCFSMDPLFDFTIYRVQVCPVLILL